MSPGETDQKRDKDSNPVAVGCTDDELRIVRLLLSNIMKFVLESITVFLLFFNCS